MLNKTDLINQPKIKANYGWFNLEVNFTFKTLI